MQKPLISLVTLAVVLCSSLAAMADIKIKQRVTTAGQKMESTRMIKGARERTEQKIELADPQAAAYFPQIATVTQCDMKRTVRLNDRKQLYTVEPFQSPADAAIEKTTPAPTKTTTTTRAGGTLTMTYTVKDTGERKMMFGLQARHLIVTQEMESSPDSCGGPNKMKMEFDGWYVDFSAEFNCPMATPQVPTRPNINKPDCIDRVVYKGSGAARTGFLLEGTMKMFAPDGSVQFTSTTETLELSRSPLEASLFDVPQGYRLADSQQDLYAISVPGMPDSESMSGSRPTSTGNTQSTPAMRTVGVVVTFASGANANQSDVENYIRGKIASRGYRPVSGSGDYTVNVQVRQIKESTAGKIGGIFGKVTGVPTSVGKVDVDLIATLSGGSSGEAKVKNKFDGPATEAIRAALDQALDQILDRIDN